MSNVSSNPTVTNCTFSDNVVPGPPYGEAGGGMFNYNSNPTVTNCTFTGNSAYEFGGGMYNRFSSPTLTNCTFFENSTNQQGGGMHNLDESNPTVINTIFWNNYAPEGPEIWTGTSSWPSIVTISYSDVKGGQSSVYIDPGCTLNWGPGMIDTDPLFVVGPNGLYYLSQIAAGQSSDSPCINAGSDLAINLGMDTFWTRTDSVTDSGVVDMGFHYGTFSSTWTVPLYQDVYIISESTGGFSNLFLNAGIENSNRKYFVLGSVSGTEPGIPLPGGMAILPVNWDFFTNIVINLANTAIFDNFLGTLDGTGSAAATLNMPPVPGAAGITMYYAYALNNPWDFVSNPLAVEIVQ
jgi:hypothetical protein